MRYATRQFVGAMSYWLRQIGLGISTNRQAAMHRIRVLQHARQDGGEYFRRLCRSEAGGVEVVMAKKLKVFVVDGGRVRTIKLPDPRRTFVEEFNRNASGTGMKATTRKPKR